MRLPSPEEYAEYCGCDETEPPHGVEEKPYSLRSCPIEVEVGRLAEDEKPHNGGGKYEEEQDCKRSEETSHFAEEPLPIEKDPCYPGGVEEHAEGVYDALYCQFGVVHIPSGMTVRRAAGFLVGGPPFGRASRAKNFLPQTPPFFARSPCGVKICPTN